MRTTAVSGRTPCNICGKPSISRGWCSTHYQRWKRHGDPTVTHLPLRGVSLETYLQTKGWDVVPGSLGTPCWEWRGERIWSGYGQVTSQGKRTSAHRAAYEVWVGPIPDGLLVRHRCDNPPCMNPDHLISGDYVENAQDMIDRNRVNPTRGEKSGTAKLTAGQVDEIRAAYVPYKISQRELGERYGVTQTTIGRLLRGESWQAGSTTTH